jgi:hypothetical protein
MPPITNLAGRTFGRLTAIELERMAHSHAYWRWREPGKRRY